MSCVAHKVPTLDRLCLTLAMLARNPEVSASEIADELGVHVKTAHRYLNALDAAGVQPRHYVHLAYAEAKREGRRLPAPGAKPRRVLALCMCGALKGAHPTRTCRTFEQRGL